VSRRILLPLPRLALSSLPVVALVVLVKLGFELAGVHPLRPNPLLSGVVAASVFLLGFLLAGTVADYKESERLPGDIAATLETIADECLIVHQTPGSPAAAEGLVILRDIAVSIDDWVHRRGDLDAVLAKIRALNGPFLAFTPITLPGFVARLKSEQSALRRMVLRIETIRSTSFVAAGYTITELTGVLLVVGLVLSDLGRMPEALFFTGMLTLLLSYMFLLIRDLDDPFRYAKGVEAAADVSLAPLHAVAARLAAEHARISGTATA
jgi:branched-subunit amino acid transport protein AzlD